MLSPVIQTALAHRSIRKFKPQAIRADTLRAVLEAGQAASSSSFMQIVSIIRVSDPAIRAQIRPICAAGGKGASKAMWKPRPSSSCSAPTPRAMPTSPPMPS